MFSKQTKQFFFFFIQKKTTKILMIFLNVNKLNKCYSSINRNNQRIVQRFRGTISGKDVSPGDNAGSKNDDNSTKSSTAKEPEIIKRKNSRTQPLKMVDSLDGTSVVADFENQKANSRKKYFSAAHVKGMGGNFIRAPWEQDLVTPEVSTPSNSTSAPSSNPNSMMHLNKFLKSPKTVSILGVPMSFGQTLAGTDLGPELIREAGLSTALKRLGWRISNDTNLQVEVPTSKDSEADALFCQKTGALAHNASSVGRVRHHYAYQIVYSFYPCFFK